MGFETAHERPIVVVQELVAAGPGARRSGTSFTPDGRWQQDQIADAYRRSGRVTTYVGDWHSHPRGTGKLSRLDKRTARRVAREPAARCPHPLSMILIRDDEQWKPRPYRYRRGGPVLIPYEILRS